MNIFQSFWGSLKSKLYGYTYDSQKCRYRHNGQKETHTKKGQTFGIVMMAKKKLTHK